MTPSAKLRALLGSDRFIYAPAAHDPMTARMIQEAGIEAMACGGYATGAALCITEPLLTMTEQIAIAGAAARAVDIPLIVDAGAGFGEPLHTMRTVRECIRAGIAGAHIEDQIYPKRAHYHKYIAHTIPLDDYIAKIRLACNERDRLDKDFVIIARTDTCRSDGLDEAARRVNAAASVGADMGLLFPRNREEAERAPSLCEVPLVYVFSRGNRDGRPMFSAGELAEMGYKIGLDAQLLLLVTYHFGKMALNAMRETGSYGELQDNDWVTARKSVEDLIGLEEYYAIEEETVEGGRAPNAPS